MLNSPFIQVIVSLVLLIFLGYFAYYVYLIEFEQMLKNSNDVRKQIKILDGIYDMNDGQRQYETNDKSKDSYVDINPSINQEGGAEYSYNFWIYVNKDELYKAYNNERYENRKDIILFLKGEKKLYYSESNKNCSNRLSSNVKNFNVMIKNPLIRLSPDGSSIVVEYNNIYNPDSFQNRANHLKSCAAIDANSWMEKNKNLIGVWDLEFNQKWFMVTVIMKEVSDSNNILMKNRASCKMYVNGMNVLDRKVETFYNGATYSATFKNNKSPLFINPNFNTLKESFINTYANNKINKAEIIKMADLTYFNYAVTEKDVAQLYSNGFSKKKANPPKTTEERYDLVTTAEMELNKIKEI